VPIVPLAQQYSLIPDAHPRLQYAIETVRPALVFADDGHLYSAALALRFMDGIEKVVTRNGDASFTPFSDLPTKRRMSTKLTPPLAQRRSQRSSLPPALQPTQKAC
jgi:hypothetical protein